MNGILLNGKLLKASQLQDLLKTLTSDAPQWEASLYMFLQDWFSGSDHIVLKTSGSTGIPKSILLPKETMRASARATNAFFGLKKGDKVLLCLSADYIAGKMMLVRAMEGELDLTVVAPSSTPLDGLDEEYAFCAMVPMQVEQTIGNSGVASFNRIRNLIIGGSAVAPALAAILKQTDCICYATYGMTETASHVALRKLNGTSETEVYAALDGISFHQDGRGCLIVNAPMLVSEPLVTNDVVELLDERHFRWKGRFDFVVNSGGVKLFPEEIEKKIASLIDCRFYIGKMADERLGEALVLVMESEKKSEEEEIQLLSRIREKAGKYELPRKLIYQSEFDETPGGKIKRQTH